MIRQLQFLLLFSPIFAISLVGNAHAGPIDVQGELFAALLPGETEKQVLLNADEVTYRLTFAENWTFDRPENTESVFQLGHFYQLKGEVYYSPGAEIYWEAPQCFRECYLS